MAHEYTVLANRFKKMTLTEAEYGLLKIAENDRAGREIGGNVGDYYGTHTLLEVLDPMKKAQPGLMALLDEHGIIEPYGHPLRFIVTEKGRLLMRVYELETALHQLQHR